MKDPNFKQTVVLICQHDEGGAIGVIINRDTEIELRDLLEQMEFDNATLAQGKVLEGGPVERGAGFVLFRGTVADDVGWNLPHEVAVSPSRETLEQVLIDPRSDYRICLGYAGWAPGQLEREIETGSWLYTDIDSALVFQIPVGERYDRALASLGLTSSQVWMTPIDV